MMAFVMLEEDVAKMDNENYYKICTISSNIFDIDTYEYAKNKYQIDYSVLLMYTINSDNLELFKHIILQNIITKDQIYNALFYLRGYINDSNRTYQYLKSSSII